MNLLEKSDDEIINSSLIILLSNSTSVLSEDIFEIKYFNPTSDANIFL